jgi:hypothetical protein
MAMWMVSSGCTLGPVAGFCEYSDEHTGSVKELFFTSCVTFMFSRTFLHDFNYN